MVAEKQLCWTKATVRGPAGHGSMPVRGGAMASLGKLLERIDRRRCGPRPGRDAVDDRCDRRRAAGGRRGASARAAASRADRSRARRDGRAGPDLDPLLHNTVSATIVGGGDTINVIPGEVTVELDGRLLPRFDARAAVRGAARRERRRRRARGDPQRLTRRRAGHGDVRAPGLDPQRARSGGAPIPLLLRCGQGTVASPGSASRPTGSCQCRCPRGCRSCS